MHILIIEDDQKTADFVSGAIRQSGHVTTCCNDGNTGAAAALHGTYDAAVIDVMLPKKDGLSIIRELRSSGKKLPIIVLSARGTVDARIRGLEAGADDYLAKPFSVAELLARLQALLRRTSQQDETTILKVEDLEMDLVSHRVTRGGRRIDLQPLEYQLLEYLMRNADQVITREQILEHCWDFAYSAFSNITDVYIKQLRKKLKDSNEKYIKTIRGMGYTFKSK
jgi:two-component system OmpR family response regulator